MDIRIYTILGFLKVTLELRIKTSEIGIRKKVTTHSW